MALIFDGSFKTIEERTIGRLAEEGFSVSPGSVARLLTSIINSEIADFYKVLNDHHIQAFVSTATGSFLDAIGLLVNCYRSDVEKDNDYRNRITKQILKTASSNEVSIRLAALSVEGVSDVFLKNFSHGAGTFTAIVICEEEATESILATVHSAIKETVAYGVNFIVDKPTDNRIEMNIKLVTREGTDSIVNRDMQILVKEKAKDYINSLKIGEMFVVNELTQRVMEVSENIVTYVCSDFKINKKPAKFVNQECNWTSRFVVSPEPDAITVK